MKARVDYFHIAQNNSQ